MSSLSASDALPLTNSSQPNRALYHGAGRNANLEPSAGGVAAHQLGLDYLASFRSALPNVVASICFLVRVVAVALLVDRSDTMDYVLRVFVND